MTKTISILGSTGSIGRQTLDVAEKLGVRPAALTARRDVARMEEQCRKYRPMLAVMMAAYRLFSEKSDYPLHLGVTETGTEYMTILTLNISGANNRKPCCGSCRQETCSACGRGSKSRDATILRKR